MWQPHYTHQASVKSKLGLIYATLSHQRLARNGGTFYRCLHSRQIGRTQPFFLRALSHRFI